MGYFILSIIVVVVIIAIIGKIQNKGRSYDPREARRLKLFYSGARCSNCTQVKTYCKPVENSPCAAYRGPHDVD